MASRSEIFQGLGILEENKQTTKKNKKKHEWGSSKLEASRTKNNYDKSFIKIYIDNNYKWIDKKEQF